MSEEIHASAEPEIAPKRGRKPKAHDPAEVIANAAEVIRRALADNDTRDAGKALTRLEQVQEHAALALKG